MIAAVTATWIGVGVLSAGAVLRIVAHIREVPRQCALRRRQLQGFDCVNLQAATYTHELLMIAAAEGMPFIHGTLWRACQHNQLHRYRYVRLMTGLGDDRLAAAN